jgi:hypothetical protein
LKKSAKIRHLADNFSGFWANADIWNVFWRKKRAAEQKFALIFFGMFASEDFLLLCRLILHNPIFATDI